MPEVREIQVLRSILSANDLLAQKIRERFSRQGTLLVNLLSSPGAGKTALLEATVERLKDQYRILALEGDIETERDAQRLRGKGIRALQITTGGACHLEAQMIYSALEAVPEGERYDFVFIENVGNLVCPAGWFLGEHLRVVLLSVPEGDDKPKKYPLAFRTAHALVITKADLLPYLPFDPDRAEEEARQINPELRTFRTSALTGEGVEAWCGFLEEVLQDLRTGNFFLRPPRSSG